MADARGQNQTVAVSGKRMEYRRIGGGEGPTLVFLHQGLGSIELWRDFPHRVAEATGLPSLVYSRAGHGWSDPLDQPHTPRFLHDEAEDVLPLLLDSLRIETPILIGHSEGASIALIHAGTGHPVRGLILLAPHVFVEPESIAGIEAARERFVSSDLARRMSRYHRDPAAVFWAWNDIWLDPEFRHWNIEGILPGISPQLLMIQGLDDEYGTLAQLEAIESAVPGPTERLVLADCGHSPHLSQPDRVLDAIARFVGRIEPGS